MKKISTTIILSSLLFCQYACGQKLTKPSIPGIKVLVSNINVNNDYKGGNWKPVLDAVKDKSIVLLGEPNHGSKEVFVTRNELIKSLHEQLGFDVVLFESGIGEVSAIEINKVNLDGKQLTYGFFGGWRTTEFVDLMNYLKNNNIAVGGFDVQKTGNEFAKLLEEQAKQYFIDKTYFEELEERFNEQKSLLTNKKAVFDSLLSSTQDLINDYTLLINLFRKKAKNSSKKVLIVERTLENRISYLEYFLEFTKTKDWNKRWKTRDSIMASNVEWLTENIYKDKKVVIVAHNFHVAKFNKKEEVMGEFLLNKYNSKMYVLGVFAGSGSYADNSGKETKMKPVETRVLDIKEIILSLNGRVHFLNIPKKKTTKMISYLMRLR